MSTACIACTFAAMAGDRAIAERVIGTSVPFSARARAKALIIGIAYQREGLVILCEPCTALLADACTMLRVVVERETLAAGELPQ